MTNTYLWGNFRLPLERNVDDALSAIIGSGREEMMKVRRTSEEDSVKSISILVCMLLTQIRQRVISW